MYYCTTKDFTNFSETRLLYDHGFNVIDATIHKIEGEFVMFLKDETKNPEPEKNIRIARSKELYGNYTAASEPITGDWVEGPTAVQTESGWVVFFDMYRAHKMGAVFSTDLQNWTDISDQVRFPEGTRHGSVFTVERSIFHNLMENFHP
jgi:hypothetical protein